MHLQHRTTSCSTPKCTTSTYTIQCIIVQIILRIHQHGTSVREKHARVCIQNQLKITLLWYNLASPNRTSL